MQVSSDIGWRLPTSSQQSVVSTHEQRPAYLDYRHITVKRNRVASQCSVTAIAVKSCSVCSHLYVCAYIYMHIGVYPTTEVLQRLQEVEASAHQQKGLAEELMQQIADLNNHSTNMHADTQV